MALTINIKRAYDSATEDDGYRILVDKFWPRGIKKNELKADCWPKNICPPDSLRHFFHEDIENNWERFACDYESFLLQSEDLKRWIKQWTDAGHTKITLLYASKHAEKNHALILKKVMEQIA
jgi:uncharacterized protein YeaO (DUF488 family)